MKKRDLSKLKKMKPQWDKLNDDHNKLLEQRIRRSMDPENIDEVKVQAELKKYKSVETIFPKPIVISNIYIGKDFYPKIVIEKAFIFAKDKIPPNCFMLPNVYKKSIIKYTAKDNSALMVVARKDFTEINPNKLDFEIIDTKFIKEVFTPYPNTGMTHHDLRYLLRYKRYKTLEEKDLGEFTFTFLFNMSNIGKIELEGISLIKSKNQEELIKLLKNKDQKLKARFLDKLFHRCFLKGKEISKRENFSLPDVDWFMKQLTIKKKEFKKKLFS